MFGSRERTSDECCQEFKILAKYMPSDPVDEMKNCVLKVVFIAKQQKRKQGGIY